MLSSDASSFGPISGVLPTSRAVGVFKDAALSYTPLVAGEVAELTLTFGLGPGTMTADDGYIR